MVTYLSESIPPSYRAFCEKVGDLLGGRSEPNPGEFLIDQARQPVPLSLKQFIDGLLSPVHMRSGLFNFNLWQWREFYEVLVFNNESKGKGTMDVPETVEPVKVCWRLSIIGGGTCGISFGIQAEARIGGGVAGGGIKRKVEGAGEGVSRTSFAPDVHHC